VARRARARRGGRDRFSVLLLSVFYRSRSPQELAAAGDARIYGTPPRPPRGRHARPSVLPCTMALPPSQASSRAGRILFTQVRMRPLTRACFSFPCDRYAAPLQDWPQPAQTSWAPALTMAEGPSYKLRAALIFPSYLRRQPRGGLHVLCPHGRRARAWIFTWNQRRSRQPCDDEQSEPGEVSRTPDTGGLQAGSSELRLPRLLYTTTPATHRACCACRGRAGSYVWQPRTTTL
jgi:hypothetical protein